MFQWMMMQKYFEKCLYPVIGDWIQSKSQIIDISVTCFPYIWYLLVILKNTVNVLVLTQPKVDSTTSNLQETTLYFYYFSIMIKI